MLSRRNFLKASLLSIGATILAACERVFSPTSETEIPVVDTNTSIPEPTSTNTLTSTTTETATEITTATETPCFKLLTPEDGATLRAQGRVTFSWEAMPGVVGYKLEIVLPGGQVVALESTGTSYDLYIEVLSMGGEFQWRVIALDASAVAICITEEFTFEKPEYFPLEPTPTIWSDGSASSDPGSNTNSVSLSDTTQG